jgi:hypothetical protein
MRYARAYTDTAETGWADDAPGTPVPFTASTPGVKRDGLDLRAAGWRTDRYARSPVVLWCHDHKMPPIGTATTGVERDRLRMPVTFDQEDPFARQIESKVRRRIIRACSVGWDFVDADGRLLDLRGLSVEDLRDRAWYDLTELSIVPVGADPDALTERRRSALRALSRELAGLYDAQEQPGSDATGGQIRAAVRAELVRLGVDPDTLARPLSGEPPVAGPALVRVDEQALATALRAAFGDLLTARGTRRAAVPPHDTAVEDGAWDGPAAVAACPADQDALRAIHAWVDTDGDPDAKGSYKLPHHGEPGGPANLAGVRNALARLPQADIPESERPGVERHLRNHLDAGNHGADDASPPDSAARAAAPEHDAAHLVAALFEEIN